MFSSPVVIVTIERNLVSFVSDDRRFETIPTVYFSTSENEKILSIGATPEVSEYRPVHLFDGREDEANKGLVLEAFFRYGLKKVARGFLSPRVQFEVSQEIVTYFGGFHSYALYYAAKHSGAVATNYDSDFDFSRTNRRNRPKPNGLSG